MPLKINGTTIPYSGIVIVISAIFWLATLSVQVKANGDDIAEQALTPVRLATIELTLQHIKEDMADEKIAQAKKDQANNKKLDRILDKLDE